MRRYIMYVWPNEKKDTEGTGPEDGTHVTSHSYYETISCELDIAQ
jgi:hypothetical protein